MSDDRSAGGAALGAAKDDRSADINAGSPWAMGILPNSPADAATLVGSLVATMGNDSISTEVSDDAVDDGGIAANFDRNGNSSVGSAVSTAAGNAMATRAVIGGRANTTPTMNAGAGTAMADAVNQSSGLAGEQNSDVTRDASAVNEANVATDYVNPLTRLSGPAAGREASPNGLLARNGFATGSDQLSAGTDLVTEEINRRPEVTDTTSARIAAASRNDQNSTLAAAALDRSTTTAAVPSANALSANADTDGTTISGSTPDTDAAAAAGDDGALMGDGQNLSLPRGASASANAVRVHAAIEQARLQGISPGSLVAEKFAASSGEFSETPVAGKLSGQRKTLDAGVKEVMGRYTPVGINVAKGEATMPAPSTLTSSPSGAAEALSFSASPLAFDSLVPTDVDSSEFVSGARRAVESAVALTERFSSTDRNSVNLQFKVSGQDLAVRVEMRADGVHTTFRTESPELRAALAQEWQTVTAQTPDRAVRLVEPTFSSNAAGGGLQSDTSSAHQRQSDARQPEASAQPFNLGRNLQRMAPAAVTNTLLPAAASVAPGRLRTFA